MKRILSIILASVMLLSCMIIPSFAEEYNLWDTNGDGKYNLADVSMLLKYLARWDLGSERMERIRMTGDVNEDGIINMADAAYYLKTLPQGGPYFDINDFNK